MDRCLREHPANTAAPAAQAKRAPHFHPSVSRHSQLFRLGLFLFAGFLALPAYASSPEDERSPLWKEVLSFAPANLGPVTWCGPKIIVAKEYDQFEQAGGIVHINVETKKVTWVTKNPLTKDPFCSYDGTTVFYYQLRENPKIEPEGLEFDGVWAYNLKTKKTSKVGDLPPDRVAINLISPAQNIYALVARERKYLSHLEVNLPEWRILRLPLDNREVDGVSQWASDGSYLVLSERDKDKPVEKFVLRKAGIFVFLDPAGRQLGEVPYVALRPGIVGAPPRALGDGLYIFDADGRLRRVNPRTSGIEILPLQVTVSEKQLFTFDVSPAGELTYSRLDGLRIGERPFLWLTNVSGGPGYSLRIRAHHPRFSPTGEYLAVIQRDKRGNGVLTVLRRPTNQIDQ